MKQAFIIAALATTAVLLLSSGASAETIDWEYQLQSPTKFIKGNILLSVDGSAMYTLDDKATVYKLNTTSGAQIWKSNVIGDDNITEFGIQTKFALVDGGSNLILSDGVQLYGLSHDTGAFAWKEKPIAEGFTALSQPKYNIFATSYGGDYNGPSIFFDSATGKQLWKFDNDTMLTATQIMDNKALISYQVIINGSIVTEDVKIFNITNGDELYTVKNGLTCNPFDASAQYVACLTTPTPYDGTNQAHNVEVIELNTFTTVWKSALPRPSIYYTTYLRIVGSNLVITSLPGTFKGWLGVFNLTTGATIRISDIKQHLMGVADDTPRFDGYNVVAYQTLDGIHYGAYPTTIAGMDIPSGKVFWEFRPPVSSYEATMFILPDNTFVVPNLVGWTRFTPPAVDRGNVTVNYFTLNHPGGISGMIANGNGYIVVTGTTVTQYTSGN